MPRRRAHSRPPFAFWGGVQGQSNSSVSTPPKAPDLRRAISRQVWLANRARNALRRPAFIGAISVATFITALVSMVTVPRGADTPAPINTRPRPDTLSLAGAAAAGRVKLVEADSALAKGRADIDAVTAAAAAVTLDTVAMADAVARDTARARLEALEEQLKRAEQAPLLSSYKSLAEVPDLRGDARVRALLDTLADIEREREGFGAAGGVDPIFVALTSRASEVGRTIQRIARERRDALLEQVSSIAPSDTAATEPVADTVALIAARDSVRSSIQAVEHELERRRLTSRAIDIAEERERARANAVAPTLALLASAFVLSWVIGFGVALFGELKKPRVSNTAELERFVGVRVLSTVEPSAPSVDRGRREADRAAPPYLDPAAEGYQLAYLGLATDHPTVLMATVTGDDPVIAAVVASNLAAVAADEARNALIVDLEPSCSASAVLRARSKPGVVDILTRGASWPDVTTPARIGRDKTIDLVPHGPAHDVASHQFAALLKQDSLRLARYYDAIIVLASVANAAEGVPAVLPSQEIIFCAQPGITPLRQLRAQLERMRTSGGSVRGVVLWQAERPLLSAARDDTQQTAPTTGRPREEAVTV
jgi:Mrp family chromosome partitioning ATPase